jgi:hypothetical protein
MTKKDILIAIKFLKDKSYELCLKKNVITKEEFVKLTDRLYKDICNLEKEVGEDK